MSHTFYLSNVESIDYARLQKELAAYNMDFLEGYPASEKNAWPNGTTYVHQQNISCRPPEVTFQSGVFEVRIFAGSAEEDYRLGLALASAVARQAGVKIQPEDSARELSVEELSEEYGEDWLKEHSKTTLGMLLGRIAKDPESTVTMGPLQIGKRFMRQLLANKDSLAEEFFERFRLLNYGVEQGMFFQSSVFETTFKEQNKAVRMSVYGGAVPTLLSDQAHVVMLQHPKDDQCMEIDIDVLADLMGGKAKWISESLLLAPEINDEEWQALFERAKEHQIEDITRLGEDIKAEGIKEEEAIGGFTETEWNILSSAPLLVFALVSAADGKIDANEVKSFQNEVLSGVNTENVTLQRILMLAMANFAPMMQGIMKGQIDPLQSLIAVSGFLDRQLEKQEAEEIKKAFYNIGKSVAEASGGLFGLFGSKISKEEKKALEALAKIFDINAG